jgi:hypothetical protein
MRTKTIKVYKFSELSEKAKERAKQDHAAAMGFSWGDEYLDSIKALAKHFGGTLKSWEVDWFDSVPCSPPTFEMPEMGAAEIKARLKQLGTYNKRTGKGDGECKLTGFCADECAIDGFRIAHRGGERDLTALMEAAYDTWLKAAQADCADQFSDEQFSENCEANDYEFYEDGSFA